jgi:hypothetical protein
MRKLWIATFAAAVLGSSPALAINTHLGWDGSSAVSSFGCPDTTNYGQVITIPKFKHTLGTFSFWQRAQAIGGSMVVRAEVYAWDGAKATGSGLYESAPRTIAYTDSKFHREIFSANVSVTPGAKYLLFLTVDKDFDQCSAGYVTTWGLVDETTYAGGSFYYLNSTGNSADWTTSDWSNFGGDLVFTAGMPN